ncbi:MAG: hypothetical protein JWR19_2908 [Pedosphaera sp.]|nr:hypothetical protein [Pedosphaera sp.]
MTAEPPTNPQPTNRPRAPMAAEFIVLFCRYLCAILVTLSVSIFVLLLGVRVLDMSVIHFLSGAFPHDGGASTVITYIAALAGILLGSLCLPRRSRGWAGVALLILGLALYYMCWYTSWQLQVPGKHGHFSLLLPLAAGGLSALWLSALISRRAVRAKIPKL